MRNILSTALLGGAYSLRSRNGYRLGAVLVVLLGVMPDMLKEAYAGPLPVLPGMIVVASPKDHTIIQRSQRQSQLSHDIFGDTYVMGTDQIPQLGLNENLFIIGHGIKKGDSGLAEIGDEEGGLSMSGDELFDNLYPVFPAGYAADVYIDACESANVSRGEFSLIELFHTKIANIFKDVRVFGHTGEICGDILPPGDPRWRESTN